VVSHVASDTMKRHPFIDGLKRAITEAKLPYLTLERATGVKRQSIMRFMRGERTLRLDIADSLAGFLGLKVLQPKRRKAR